MTPGDRETLEAFGMRLRHVSATANLIARGSDLSRDEGDAIAGIGETLEELHIRLDQIVKQATFQP